MTKCAATAWRQENAELVSLVTPHAAACTDTAGGAVWLGLQARDYVWYALQQDGTASQQQFLNWRLKPPYYPVRSPKKTRRWCEEHILSR